MDPQKQMSKYKKFPVDLLDLLHLRLRHTSSAGLCLENGAQLDTSPLQGLQELEDISFNGSRSITDAVAIGKLRKLKSLDLRDRCPLSGPERCGGRSRRRSVICDQKHACVCKLKGVGNGVAALPPAASHEKPYSLSHSRTLKHFLAGGSGMSNRSPLAQPGLVIQ